MAEESSETSNSFSFPGLNKRHGFFKAIERNQRDRESYHQEWEEWRESRQGEVKREQRETRPRRSSGKPPKVPLYLPPHQRQQGEGERQPPPAAAVYQLEIEVGPHTWHSQPVNKCGQSKRLAEEITSNYSLSQTQKLALENMIKEFEQSLEL